jgi:hypothetical protein
MVLETVKQLHEVIEAYTAENIFLYTVVDIGSDGYADAVKNWALGVEGSFSSHELKCKRLIVALNEESCMKLEAKGVRGCVVDKVTPTQFEPAARPGADFNSMGGLVTFKYYWTQQALHLRKQVLYTDADVIFRRTKDPLDALLVSPRLLLGTMSNTTEPSLPDLQLISDHRYDSLAGTGRCSPTFQATLKTLIMSSVDWRMHTYGDALKNAVESMSRGPVAAKAQDFASLECDVAHIYLKPTSCVSTGFWFAQPTRPTIELFTEAMHMQTIKRPANWEQAVFNEVFPGLASTVSAIILDPRLAGNVYEQLCALSMTLDGPAAGLPQPVDPIITHFGYVKGPDKVARMKEHGMWYLP